MMNLTKYGMNWKDKIEYFYYACLRKISEIRHNIPRFFKNIWIYRKFLWVNDWWDHHFITYFLLIKLRHDIPKYEKYGLALDNQKYVNEMKICLNLLERIEKDEYYDNAFIHHDRKYGDFEERWLRNIKDDKELKSFRQCSKHEDYMRTQDYKYLFKLIGKNIQKWWD